MELLFSASSASFWQVAQKDMWCCEFAAISLQDKDESGCSFSLMPLDVPPPRVMVLHHTEKLTFLAICVDVLDLLGTSLYLWRSILAAVCANLSFLGMEVSKMSECNGVVHQQQSLSLLCSCDDLYIPLRQIPSSCILLKSLVLLVITPRFGPSLSHPISSSLVLQLFFFQVTIYDKAGPSVGFAVSKQQAIDELEALLGQICFQFLTQLLLH